MPWEKPSSLSIFYPQFLILAYVGISLTAGLERKWLQAILSDAEHISINVL